MGNGSAVLSPDRERAQWLVLVLVLFAYPLAAFVVGADTGPLPPRRNPGRRFGQETDAGPTEFTLGMDRRSDHHGGNVRRRHRHVCCVDRRSRCLRGAHWPGLAKLIARTVQFGPVEPFFSAYP